MKGRVRIYNSESGRGIVATDEAGEGGERKTYEMRDTQLADGYSSLETGQYVDFTVDSEGAKIANVKPVPD